MAFKVPGGLSGDLDFERIDQRGGFGIIGIEWQFGTCDPVFPDIAAFDVDFLSQESEIDCYEGTGHWGRRPRTCAGLETPAIQKSKRNLLCAGEMAALRTKRLWFQ